MRCLVTGGSGYFGSILVRSLVDGGEKVRVLDLNDADDRPDAVEIVLGDIRDARTVRDACDDVDVVFHNVAQVPLARDRELFESVNVGGTATLLDGARDAGVGKVVNTSSSAVFGIPASNPVFPDTTPHPVEAYGRAKLDAERLCQAAVSRGLDVTIVRPRTILGHGRLGIFSILFDWIADGVPVPVLGKGDNRYQFVHAGDLADACLRAGRRAGPAVYNVGAHEFGTMRETLQQLCDHAATGSRVFSAPARPAEIAMQAMGTLHLAPFAPYHWMLFSRSLWFDTSAAETDLGWRATWSNSAAMIDSYEWFLRNRASLGHGSHHRSPAKAGILGAIKQLARVLGR